ncbi:ethanolamine ammonia-lyase subunit EutB [Jiella pelagia]|uniref:Ethanolamine ammonia-lyase large subunit n=1 Tax=Jiella pelagia TaxID=2986949 RepID=A0ABY7C4E5_9HYPH|nr:ethanolamine ammonia-lyase subunit EutB [Jiella pelagia]WAP70616.1 ethanolamine ammonia-lyase subunit EutB [Jiella pelagia]
MSQESLKTLLAEASPARSGDFLAGVTAESQEARVKAQRRLADTGLAEILQTPLIDPETDEVQRLILDQHDREAYRPIAGFSVGDLRDWLLSDEATSEAIAALKWALTPEMVAAVSKICRNQDLIAIARKRPVVTKFRTTVGLPGRLSVRIQPNHPTDDAKGVAASILDGLAFGCGDAVIGINPATDSPSAMRRLLELIEELRLRLDCPVQSCVLAHVTTAIDCMSRGAPVDLVFQSIAGSEKANSSFGINLAMLKEAQDAAKSLNRGTIGQDVMYFETGQGAALSADAHFGIDQQTMEARAYAVARAFDPLLVNTVVGFIGPEYLYDGKEITRAGLEDHFCGKLLGVPMGVDVCYTNHAEADQDDMDNLLTLLGVAGVNFVMGVPGSDDIMLNYQSTSYHDAAYVRRALGLKPAPEFEAWLREVGVFDGEGFLLPEASRGDAGLIARSKLLEAAE